MERNSRSPGPVLEQSPEIFIDTLESLVLSTFKESRGRALYLASVTRLKRLTIILDNMSKVYYRCRTPVSWPLHI